MKAKMVIKLLLDVALTVLYLLLMFADGLGGLFHETVGILVCVLFLLHILLNRTMLKGIFAGLKKGTARLHTKLTALSDLVLLLGMPVVLCTGVLIAKDLFMPDWILPWHQITHLHTVYAYLCLGAMALHLALHGKYLKGVLQKLPTMPKKEWRTALSVFGAGAAISVLLYLSVTLLAQNYALSLPVETTPVSSAAPTETPEGAESSSSLPVDTKPEESAPEAPESEAEMPEEVVIPTLEEYLSQQQCEGCKRHCSLLNPSCSKGLEQQAIATQNYYALYPTENTTNA